MKKRIEFELSDIIEACRAYGKLDAKADIQIHAEVSGGKVTNVKAVAVGAQREADSPARTEVVTVQPE